MTANDGTITYESVKGHDAPTNLCNLPEDAALVAAAQAGTAGAMGELLARHKTALYRAAKQFTKSHEDAEDLVQDAMLRAFVNVHKFRNECHVATWLIAIVRNAAISMKRKGKNKYFESLDSKYEETRGQNCWDVPDVRLNPEQEILRKELRRFLHTVLMRQSRTHQLILQRCVFDEARVVDVASSLGLTIASAKSSLFRARRRVSNSFERRGFIKRWNPENKRGAVAERLDRAENL